MQASDGVFVVIFFKVIYNTTIMLDSVSVMSFIIKVSVSVISLSLRLGSADNTYLDLDYSGYHKNLIQ